MPRYLYALLIALVIAFGLLFLLSRLDRPRDVRTIEIPLAAPSVGDKAH